MDSNEIPINVYLDLSKAFDTLDHKMLLHKLNYYRIRFVEFNGIKSSLATITTSVSQSSILGPCYLSDTNDI